MFAIVSKVENPGKIKDALDETLTTCQTYAGAEISIRIQNYPVSI